MQCSKADVSIVEIDLGIETVLNEEKPLKANELMFFTPFLISTSVIVDANLFHGTFSEVISSVSLFLYGSPILPLPDIISLFCVGMYSHVVSPYFPPIAHFPKNCVLSVTCILERFGQL